MYIGASLMLLRHLYGYTFEEMSRKLKIEAEYFQQIERNEQNIDLKLLIDIANLLQVNPKFLMTMPVCFKNIAHLKKNRLSFRVNNIETLSRQYYLGAFLTHFTDLLYSYVKSVPIYLAKLAFEIEIHQNNQSKYQTRQEYIKEITKKTRESLLPSHINQALLFELEKAGVVIFETQIPEIESFSFWSEDGIPFIILGNNKGVAVRRNFDIAHEVGHLLLHKHIQFDLLTNEEHKMIENEANIFAAEFLLPEDEFINDFNKITKKSNPDYFKILKEKWYVSIQAMGMRAYYLNLISNSQYRYFWASINKKNFRKFEPLDDEIQMAHPVKINSLLDLLFRKKVLTPKGMLDELKVEPGFLKAIANIDYRLFERYIEKEKEAKKVSMMSDFIDISNYR